MQFGPGGPQTMQPNMHHKASIQTQICKVCKGNLPISNFGFMRYEDSGYRKECRQCRQQCFRLSRVAKYNAVSKQDDSIIRDLNKHNKKCIQQGLSTNDTSFYGYSYKDLSDVVVQINCIKEDYYSMKACKNDVELFRYSFSKTYHGIVDFLGVILVQHGLRLELSDLDRINSKVYIYSEIV